MGLGTDKIIDMPTYYVGNSDRKSADTDMATLQISEVICDKFIRESVRG
jgi:hypothetical protein